MFPGHKAPFGEGALRSGLHNATCKRPLNSVNVTASPHKLHCELKALVPHWPFGRSIDSIPGGGGAPPPPPPHTPGLAPNLKK